MVMFHFQSVSKICCSIFIQNSAGLRNTACKRWFGQPAAQTHPHLIQTGEVTPGVTRAEYDERRRRLMRKVVNCSPEPDSRHVVIVPSTTKTYMTQDIPYVFRQNSDFLYLCGFQEPDSILVLESEGTNLQSHKSLLFVPKKDAHKELWEGPRSGKDGALELTGVDHAENIDGFSGYLSSLGKNKARSCVLWYDYRKPAHMLFHVKHIAEHLRGNQLTSVESPTALIQSLRAVKSPAEVEIMAQSNSIASQAFKDVMSFSYPGINESHLYAKMDFECRMRGAEFLAYPPVVAGGNRANTIHYINNNQVVVDGDLVLMDAGCEYHGYASDITRTWPISGEFSPAQLALYEAVLELQTFCIQRCGPHGVTVNGLLNDMIAKLGGLLKELGIVGKNVTGSELNRLSREFCPHHVGHYLGMDVHDTDQMSRSINLQPGMVITVEPGIYIPSHRCDVPAEFRGQGIRIEDNILITESGYRNLTDHCPKDPRHIQDIVKSRQKQNS